MEPSGSCSRCGRPLAEDGAALCPQCEGAAQASGSAPAAQEPDPLVGEHIGEFEILEPIASGPSSRVYLARQASLDRVVALKLLAQSAARDPDQVNRFRREADAAASVSHPNVIEIHAVGRQGDHHYIAAEHVAGESLADVLEREERLPADRVVALMRQLAEALAAVHGAGIRHCDIQPANILVASDGSVKLIDFGMARRAGDPAARAPFPSALQAPVYYPPEAARGKPLDERADLYLLGATCYHALAGRPPFQADSPEERAQLYARKQAPRLGRIVPTAPAALCRLIHRLLLREPDSRCQSASELLDALDRAEAVVSNGEAESPRARRSSAPLTLAERAEVRKRQEKQVLLITAVAFSVVLIVVVVLLIALSCSRKRRSSLRDARPSASAHTGAAVESIILSFHHSIIPSASAHAGAAVQASRRESAAAPGRDAGRVSVLTELGRGATMPTRCGGRPPQAHSLV